MPKTAQNSGLFIYMYNSGMKEYLLIFAGWDYSETSMVEQIFIVLLISLLPLAVISLVLSFILKQKNLKKVSGFFCLLWIVLLIFSWQ